MSTDEQFYMDRDLNRIRNLEELERQLAAEREKVQELEERLRDMEKPPINPHAQALGRMGKGIPRPSRRKENKPSES